MVKDSSEQLKKMLNDYSKLNDSNNKSFEETMQEIDKIGNKEHSSFLRQSAIDAKNGKLDVNQFIENAKKLKDAN